MMELYDLIINEGFQSNFLDKSVYQLKSVLISFQCPSVSLTQASLEFAKVLPQFSEANEISLQINQNCIILPEGYQKIFEGLSQLKNLQKFQLLIEDKCLYDQDIFSYLIYAFQELQGLLELSITISSNNFLNINSLLKIDQIFKKIKNLQKLFFEIENQNYFQNEVLIPFYNGLSLLQNLKILYIKIDFEYQHDFIQKQLGKTLQGLEKLEILSLVTNKKLRSQTFNDIFRSLKHHPNFNNLEISAQMLEIQDVSEFIKNLQQLKSLRKIKLGQISIQCEGTIDKIQNTFLNEKQIEVCDLQIHNTEKLGSSLQLLQNLQELSLDCKKGSGNQIIDLRTLGTSLKYLHNLEKLKLELKFKYKGFKRICEGINSLQNLKQLIFRVSILKNQNRKKQGIRVGQCLKNKYNLQELVLDYKHNICLDEAVSISEGISQLINVEQVTLRLYTQIKKQCLFMIYQGFNKLQRIKHLQFQVNDRFDIFDSIVKKQVYDQTYYNSSFTFSNLINLVTLDILIVIQSQQDEVLVSLRDSFIQLKNLKQLKLDLVSHFNVGPITNLSYLTNGLESLVSLLNMEIKIDFEYNLNENEQFYEKVFKNVKHLNKLKLCITLAKQMTQNDYNDLINGFLYLKNLNQLNLFFIFTQYTFQVLDHFANILTNLENLSVLELYFLGYYNKTIKNNEKFFESFRSLKKLNHFIGPKDLIKLIKVEINQKRIQLNNLIFLKENSVYLIYDSLIKYQNWKREEIYHKNNLDQTGQDKYLQLENMQTNIDKIIIDSELSQIQITNIFLDIQKHIYLENLEILFQTNVFSSQDISLMQDSLSSLKFLKELNISTEIQSYQGPNTITQLSSLLINAISLSLKNLRYLNTLTLEISKQNEKIKLSEGISSLNSLKKLNLSLNNFSNEDLIDFNLVDTLNQLKQLNELKFGITDSAFGEKHAINLSLGLINLKKLNNLSINIGKNNQINEQGAKAIGEAINHLSQLSDLDITIGESNSIGVTGAESIMGLESYLNKLLFLSSYQIKINQKNNITSQLFDKLQKLKELNLSYINIYLDLKIVPQIEQLYQQYENFYKLLNIKQKVFVTFGKYQLITTSFRGYLKSHHFTIGFEENSLEDILFQLKPLQNNSNLKQLALQITEVSLEFAQSFEKNIQFLQNLEIFYFLDKGRKQHDNINLIANGLQKLLNLKQLVIVTSQVNISYFFQKIEVLKQLDSLYMLRSLNNQNEDQILQIIHSLSKLNKLKFLILFTEEIQKKIKSKLINCIIKSLKRLVIFEVSPNPKYRISTRNL